jgi:hypothetical protein
MNVNLRTSIGNRTARTRCSAANLPHRLGGSSTANEVNDSPTGEASPLAMCSIDPNRACFGVWDRDNSAPGGTHVPHTRHGSGSSEQVALDG